MNYIENKVIENQQFTGEIIENTEYQDCVFTKCQFTDVKMINCNFHNCEFHSCEWKLVKFEFCRMQNSSFYDCMLMGINWDELQGRGNKAFPVDSMDNCVLRYNNFVQVNLTKFDFSTSSFHDCLFLECNLTKASFKSAMFKETSFSGCNLSEADFREAHKYSIDLQKNMLKGARFSFPEVVSLLDSLDIIIE